MLVVARGLPNLQELEAWRNRLGWEAITAVSGSVTNLQKLGIGHNEEVRQGCASVGRLASLRRLYAGKLLINPGNVGLVDWSATVIACQLRRLSYIRISKCWRSIDFNLRPRECQDLILRALPREVKTY